ncbi:MAG: hypothetical protein NTY74_14750 [Ignavibacteriae bacterium]|nr:hypothetical protein [Ignavibacteriota bacterium]
MKTGISHIKNLSVNPTPSKNHPAITSILTEAHFGKSISGNANGATYSIPLNDKEAILNPILNIYIKQPNIPNIAIITSILRS